MSLQKTDIARLGADNEFQTIGKEWMLITAGDKDHFNTMTASYGGFGILWNRPVAFIFVRPERYTYEFLEQCDKVTLTFFPKDLKLKKALGILGTRSGRDGNKVAEAGITPVELESGSMAFEEARLVVDCHKLYKQQFKEELFLDHKPFEENYNDKLGSVPHYVYVLEIKDVYSNE